jgi:hypothetical protein
VVPLDDLVAPLLATLVGACVGVGSGVGVGVGSAAMAASALLSNSCFFLSISRISILASIKASSKTVV